MQELLDAAWSVLVWRSQAGDSISRAALLTFVNALKSIYGSEHSAMAINTEEGSCTRAEFKEMLKSEKDGFPWIVGLPLLGSRHGWAM